MLTAAASGITPPQSEQASGYPKATLCVLLMWLAAACVIGCLFAELHAAVGAVVGQSTGREELTKQGKADHWMVVLVTKQFASSQFGKISLQLGNQKAASFF